MTPRKILIFSRAYQNMAGGVEKMSLDLARGLSEKGHSVVILSLDSTSDVAFFDWPPTVEWVKIGIGDPSKRAGTISRLKRIKSIRGAAKKIQPDVGIGFQIGSFALLRLATIGLGIKTIAAERNSPDLFYYIRNGKLKRFFSNLILFSSYRVAVQFKNYRTKYPFWLQKKIVITPNWVKDVTAKELTVKQNGFSILFVGRLTFQKNLSVLLEATKLLPHNFKLTVIGDGPELEDLRTKARNLNQTISFEPPRYDLSSSYAEANILCLPSRWEGFPNVVAEALSFGLPVVGFAKCSGISDLISDGINGTIAEGMDDPSTLAEAIIRAHETEFVPDKIKSTVQIYSFEKFIEHWESCFE